MIAEGATTERERVVAGAWVHYRDALEGLTGREYEQAEEAAWEELQEALHRAGVRDNEGAVG